MTTTQLLKDLLGRATPGPWKWRHNELNERYKKWFKGRRAKSNQLVFSLDGAPHGDPDSPDEIRDAYDYRNIMRLWWYSVKGKEIVNANPAPANADLIIEAVNALPALLAVVEAAADVCEEWPSPHVVKTPLDRRMAELIAALAALNTEQKTNG